MAMRNSEDEFTQKSIKEEPNQMVASDLGFLPIANI